MEYTIYRKTFPSLSERMVTKSDTPLFPKGSDTAQNDRSRSTRTTFLTGDSAEGRSSETQRSGLKGELGFLCSAGLGGLSQPQFWEGSCWQKCAVVPHSLYPDWNLPLIGSFEVRKGMGRSSSSMFNPWQLTSMLPLGNILTKNRLYF